MRETVDLLRQHKDIPEREYECVFPAGVFGALLFINDLEYLGSSNTEFFKNKTLPLLEGLLDWWACYLVKRRCSPAGTHACPIDGWRYDDANDAVRT